MLHYIFVLWVPVVAEHGKSPLSHMVVPSDPTFTASGFSSFLWTKAPGCAMEYHGVMQSPADGALRHMRVLGWELPFSRPEDVFSFMICKHLSCQDHCPRLNLLGTVTP